MYYLLSEEMPYKFAKLKSDQEIYWYLKKQDLQFDQPIWSTFEHYGELREVLEGLLHKDPKNRMSAKKALRHPLFKIAKMQMRDFNSQLLKDNISFKQRKKKRTMNVIKRGVLLFIATRLLPE